MKCYRTLQSTLKALVATKALRVQRRLNVYLMATKKLGYKQSWRTFRLSVKKVR